MELKSLLQTAIQAAEEAAKAILEIYESGDFQTEAKGDNSPLTIADKKAHAIIEVILDATNLPVLSEEGKDIPYDERKTWEYFWMVDPLDGTKEFIRRNGEFTVNIALIHNHVPVLGVVAIPVTGEIFYSAQGVGAFKKSATGEEHLSKRDAINLTNTGLRVVASRSHLNTETENFINTLKEPELVSRGSSLKFLMMADGTADVYPRYAPTMEWDTAAAHAIVNQIGLKVYQIGNEQEVVYNKEDLLNPHFIVM